MNKLRFKLVFSKRLGMLVPIAEIARTHQKTVSSASASRTVNNASTIEFPFWRISSASVALLLAGYLSWFSSPVLAMDANTLPTGGNIVSGAGNIPTNPVGNVLDVTTTTQNAIIRWDSFNIGSKATVNFYMPNASSSVLNRVMGDGASYINGALNTPNGGHVYLVNQNGIYFGAGSQVNVGSLTATTLDNIFDNRIEDVYNRGILSNENEPVFSFADAVGIIEVAGAVYNEKGELVTKAADIRTAANGRVMLLAPDVKNSGVITTPDGQTLLAAGKTIYMAKQNENILVEVSSGGTVKNIGEIVVGNGNASLVGLAVNQEGRITATTSVRNNGKILLKAEEIQSKGTPANNRLGTVTLAKNSTTQVLVDTQSTEEAVLGQKLGEKNQSIVEILGKTIDIQGRVTANAGQVNVTANSNGIGESRIFLGDNALIDVSGVDANAPMSRNQLIIQLYSEQLKDSPVLRGGPLFGEFLYLDSREGTPIISQAVIEQAKLAQKETIAEAMTNGGSVKFTADSVVTKAGSVVNTSGGKTNYAAGDIKESKLLFNGNWVDASDAQAGVAYESTGSKLTIKDPRWGVTRTWDLSSSPDGSYQAGYVKGGNAGTFTVQSSQLALQGDVVANTTVGTYQRGDNANSPTPQGGALNINLTSNSNLNFVNQLSDPLNNAFNANSELSDQQKAVAEIDTKVLRQGVNRLVVNANGKINVNTQLQTNPNGSIQLDANGGLNINSNITAAGGNVILGASERTNVVLAKGVNISTSGLLTNDKPGIAGAMTGLVVKDAGNITVTDGLVMQEGARMEANAGAWIKQDKTTETGHGGDINVTLAQAKLDNDAFSAYGIYDSGKTSQGGKLTINLQGDAGTSPVKDIQIGGVNPEKADTLWLDEGFFGRGGFSHYTLSNESRQDGDMVIGQEGVTTLIQPQQRALVLDGSAQTTSSGNRINQVATLTTPPAIGRSPVSLSMQAGDDLTLHEGATIVTQAPNSKTDAKGSVSLTSNGQMTILGDITAPAADITLTIQRPEGMDPIAPNRQFDPTLSLFVGEKSVLSARGQYISPPTVDGTLRNAKVLDAGHITVKSGNGVVVLKEGSQLDVSAASGLVDLPTSNNFVRQQVDGKAGTIEIEARDGMALDGTLIGKSAGQGEAGTLKVVLGGDTWSAVEKDDNNPLFLPNGKRLLTVTQAKQVMADLNQPGSSVGNLIQTNDPDMPLTNAVGKGQVSQAQIAEGGFDHVQLHVKNVENKPDSKIVLEAGSVLAAPASVTLDATAIAGAARIQASAVSLKNTGSQQLTTPAQGAGEMVVDANFIDLIGNVALDQVSSVKLNSRTDIRGRGVANGLQSIGSLTVADKLAMDAAQIYPVSAATFNINAKGDQSLVVITNSQGTKPDVPMSAQGKLNINADQIIQAGNLRAPLGEINLNAKQSLVLAKNSLTSVSAEGSVIPYLTTVLGGNNMVEQEGNEDAIGKSKLNEKKITLNASNIDMQGGAKVDISGGGDTLSYEWLPGIGGSENVLSKQGYYAVLPKLGQQYAPYDYLMYGSAQPSDLNVGQSIYLNGGNGLAAGTYTLLPARYALVPGAYLVKVSNEIMPINTSLAQLDGSTNMSGYFTRVDGTSRGQFVSFNVLSGQVFYNNVGTKDYKGPAEYLVTLGNQFFINKSRQDAMVTPQLSADAGQLSISATSQLNLDGQIVAQKSAGSKGGLVDISSNKIQVVSNVGAIQDGVLQLSASQLSNIQADSVLLGGTRTVSGNTQTITTQASEVTFANDANHVVESAELIVSAKDKLSVKAGAVIKTGPAATQPGSVTLTTTGDGALLAVSSNNDLSLTRTGASASGGELEVEQGARVEVTRSAVLDATKRFDKSGEVSIANGGSLTLGSQQFALGDSNPNAATKIDAATLQSYGQLSAVTLNSYKQIDIYGALNFGSQDLNLRLNSSGMAHHGDGNVVINAKTLSLTNTLGNSFVAPQDVGTSQLTMNTENTVFGTGNQLNIAGFEQVNVNADQQIKFADTGKVNISAAETNLRSAVVTADTGAKYDLSTTGTLNLLSNGNAAVATTGLGANVNLSSHATTIANRVEMLAGQFKATSTNADLTVAANGQVITKATTVKFDQTHSKTTDAGSVSLISNTGNVVVADKALIDISGGEQSGDAGTLNVDAKRGQFTVADGTLKASAAGKQKRGQFNLDVDQLGNFSEVNQALETGQFNEARDLRVRSGNVDIQSTDTVTAKQFTLGVDNGNIQVAGTVNADGDKGGDVAMYASGTVTLKNTARITAKGTQANQSNGDLQTGSGGDVLLSSNSLSTTNAVFAEAGALIDVSGYDKKANNNAGVDGADGSVTLRGRRGTTGTANTVNVAFNTTSAIKGASEVRVEGVRTYTATTFASTIAGLVTDTNNFYNANQTAGSYANTQDGVAALILPYIEVRSTSGNTTTNMTSSADHNLRAFGSGVNTLIAGRGGVLSLRSSGDLRVGTISDGFSTPTAAGLLESNAQTFDISLIAGADYSSANVNKTVQDTGNLTLSNGKIIRTGEGDITVAAGNDITLGTGVIYTAGKASPDAVGFSKPSAATAASYVNNGGDINIIAQGNISGTATTQSVNQWLLRQAGNESSETDTSWWVRPDLFQQGVAALGGGDVKVSAGGNITNVSASSATNAQFDNKGEKHTNNSVINGGGDVTVNAGGNITNGVYYVGRGELNIGANGNIGKSGSANSQGLLIALQDASAKVSAIGDVKVDTVFNPTLWAQGSTNSLVADNHNYFNTYSSDSSFDVSGLVGNVQIGLQHRDNISSTGLSTATTTLKQHDYGAIHPGKVSVTAFNGDITSYKMILSPASDGQLQLMASNNITAVNSNSTGSQSPTGTVIISDADVLSQFTIDNPFVGDVRLSALNQQLASFKTGNSAVPVHKNNNNQSVIIAKEGSVSFKGAPSSSDSANVYGLKSSMPVYISAGKDVTMHASIQHNNQGDISIVKAGNDFVMDLPNPDAEFVVNGPGDLLIEASRNINLGKTNGVLSVANTVNANLPENGANITMLAGLGKDGASVSEFVNTYINPNGVGPQSIAGDAEKLSAYRTVVADSVQGYMQNKTGSSLSKEQAMALFLALAVDEQKPLAYALYGIEMTNAIVDYVQTGKANRGEELIAAMFPKTRIYEGDMLMYQSQVKTLRFADINLLTPGGLINAGVPAAAGADAGKEIGIVTEKGGALRVYADKGFEINQSKVSTLFGVKGGGSDQDADGNLLGVRGKGSDLSAWVNNGDIDAGRGSKTALAVPERLGKLDDFGNRIVELKGVAAGSGISTSTYDPDGPIGNQKEVKAGVVFLAAPNGVLDAGEAGVSSGADLFVGAQVINNATNISAAGSSAGVPVSDTGGLAGAALSATNTSAGASNALTENIANQMNNQNVAPKELPPIVTVKTIRLED
ncbi:filamentous haemagglutinin family protein [Methylophilus sp. TWE2]|uniref:filamentous haemagglutinin family protein n=1 Tax=Methylophilus sp. TWE2 TaxID=1662285 RepID=UPI000A601B32|nr:filamentous haemagglutinin family protein [Methylophilus sp. TWE2]